MALQSLTDSQLRILAADPPDRGDPSDWTGLAATVYDLHARVTREKLHFGDVAEKCRTGLLFDDSRRWELLAHLRFDYLELLREWGRCDRFEARIDALDEGNVEVLPLDGRSMERIHLVGMADVPRVAEEMLSEIAEAPTRSDSAEGTSARIVAWIHAPEELAEGFDRVGRIRSDFWTRRELSIADRSLSVCDGPGEQADEVLRVLSGLDQRFSPENIAVGVPDREVAPRLEQRLGAHGVPHRVARGTPLEETSPYRLLEATAAYLEGRRFVDLAALVRHPAVEDVLDRAWGGTGISGTARGGSDLLDRYHEAHLPYRVDAEEVGGERQGLREAVREMTAALHGPTVFGDLAPLEGRGPKLGLARWMPRILDFLVRVYGHRPLKRGFPEDRVLLEALERIKDRAASFYALPGEADQSTGASAAIRCLLAELQSSDAVPPEPGRASVELLEWLELHLDDAPVLVLTGCNEGRIIEAGPDHPFLPDGLRSALGVPDHEARHARDVYYLSAMAACREVLHVVAGRVSATGDPLRPSRLLLAERGRRLAERVLRFSETDEPPSPPLAPPHIFPASESRFTAPPCPEIILAEAPTSFRVTEFKDLLQDRYRWHLERSLGLRERHDRRRELDPSAFGSLAHRVLERFGDAELESASSGTRDPLDVDDVRLRLERILDAEARYRFSGTVAPAVKLQIEQLRLRFRALAEWHAARAHEGWRIVGREVETPEGGVPLDVDGTPVRLYGRIDRIDIHEGTGAIALFDYKTGESATDPDRAHRNRRNEWIDLQLPLYDYLLPSLISVLPGVDPDTVRSASAVKLGYINLPRDPGQTGHTLAPWGRGELEGALEAARDAIRALRADPVLTFDPRTTRIQEWDPFGPLLGRGVLALTGAVDTDPGDSRSGNGWT